MAHFLSRLMNYWSFNEPVGFKDSVLEMLSHFAHLPFHVCRVDDPPREPFHCPVEWPLATGERGKWTRTRGRARIEGSEGANRARRRACRPLTGALAQPNCWGRPGVGRRRLDWVAGDRAELGLRLGTVQYLITLWR